MKGLVGGRDGVFFTEMMNCPYEETTGNDAVASEHAAFEKHKYEVVNVQFIVIVLLCIPFVIISHYVSINMLLTNYVFENKVFTQ